MLNGIREYFSCIRDLWLECDTVGWCVAFILIFIGTIPLQILYLLFLPFKLLFSIPVHRGDFNE